MSKKVKTIFGNYLVDILTKNQKKLKALNDYRNFDKMEIFALITFNAIEVKSKEDLKKLQISYVDALKYLKVHSINKTFFFTINIVCRMFFRYFSMTK